MPLAELSFVHAQNSGKRIYYLASAIYAYAFLFPGEHGTPPKGLDPRFRWAADIYNQALTRAAMLDGQEYPAPRGGQFKLPFGEITVEFDQAELLWAGFRLTNFVPAADVEIRGLQNRYRLPGIGAPLAATIEPIEGFTIKQSARVPPRIKIPTTGFLRLDDPRGNAQVGKNKRHAAILYAGVDAFGQNRGCRCAGRIRNHFCIGVDFGGFTDLGP